MSDALGGMDWRDATWRQFGAANPPSPFNLDELHPAGLLPDRVYTKPEMRCYLEHGRRKCRATITTLGDVDEAKPSGFERLGVTRYELLLYNLRHVQHHAAQLNLILRQRIDSAPRWVKKTLEPRVATTSS